MKTVVFVIMDRFADWEGAFLAAALQGEVAQDVRVLYASDTRGPLNSIGGLSVNPQLTLDEVPKDAEALVFIGADGSWHQLREGAAKLAKQFKEEGKVVAAICDAARWLGSIGLLNDVKHTANFKEELLQQEAYTNGDNFVEEDAVRDGRLVTANGNAPLKFAREVLLAMGMDENKTQEFVDFHTLGLQMALKKYGYI